MRENLSRDFGDVTLVQNLFKPIRAINRTNFRPIWTPTCEDIDHIEKIAPKPLPKKKKIPIWKKNTDQYFNVFQKRISFSIAAMFRIYICFAKSFWCASRCWEDFERRRSHVLQVYAIYPNVACVELQCWALCWKICPPFESNNLFQRNLFTKKVDKGGS